MRWLICFAFVAAGAIALNSQGQSAAVDWPQWRGPATGCRRRRAVAAVAGGRASATLVHSNLGAGFGSIAVRGDRVFVQGMRNSQSIVSALNRADGKVCGQGPSAGRARMTGEPVQGYPTVDGDRMYVLTENGDLACLRVQDGTVVWQRNILKDFGGRNIGWLLSESPLVDGKQVMVTPGGRGAGMVALDKMTGKTIWTARS